MHTIDIDGQQVEIRAMYREHVATTPCAFVRGQFVGMFLGCGVIARPFLMMGGKAFELTPQQKALVMDVYTREVLPHLGRAATASIAPAPSPVHAKRKTDPTD